MTGNALWFPKHRGCVVVWFTMLEELPYFDGAGAPYFKMGYPKPPLTRCHLVAPNLPIHPYSGPGR
jgi:hypothetical protein